MINGDTMSEESSQAGSTVPSLFLQTSGLLALAASFGLGFFPIASHSPNSQTWWSGHNLSMYLICLGIPAALLLISIPLRKHMVAYRVCAGLFICAMANVLVMQVAAVSLIRSETSSPGSVSTSLYLMTACTVITLIIGLAMLFWRNSAYDSQPGVLPDA